MSNSKPTTKPLPPHPTTLNAEEYRRIISLLHDDDFLRLVDAAAELTREELLSVLLQVAANPRDLLNAHVTMHPVALSTITMMKTRCFTE